MANYLVDASVLLPFVPAGTTLDLYNGNVYVSLVGFMFTNTRLLGIRIPFHVNFEEVNLRFYVRYNDGGVWKRGTVFIKEIVPRRAIGFIANNLYQENYSSMPMKHFLRKTASETRLGYHWKYKNKWNRLEAVVTGDAVSMATGSSEEFIAEHYWGYSKYSDSRTVEYEVVHPPWNIFAVTEHVVDCDFAALYGPAFSMLDDMEPASVFVAEGSAIRILHKRNL